MNPYESYNTVDLMRRYQVNLDLWEHFQWLLDFYGPILEDPVKSKEHLEKLRRDVEQFKQDTFAVLLEVQRRAKCTT